MGPQFLLSWMLYSVPATLYKAHAWSCKDPFIVLYFCLEMISEQQGGSVQVMFELLTLSYAVKESAIPCPNKWVYQHPVKVAQTLSLSQVVIE